MKRAAFSCAALLLSAAPALAHPSPAEPPAFFDADCIIIVDKREQPSWHLDYAVLSDDTAFEVDHVSLPDSKTHQFFALSGTLLERGMAHEFLPFDDEAGNAQPMPTWLTAEDVMRTEAGVAHEDMTGFTADQVVAEDILASDPLLSSAVRPLVAGTYRVPITQAQASAGVDWDLRDVPPGVYQIAAYIFSPPYNGWAVRPGVIKIVDGAEDEPGAVMLHRVEARLFAGQGRRVRGCVDAPSGSMLHLYTRARAEVPTPFELWTMQPVSNGPFELCLENDGQDALLELRAEVRAPSGLLSATQSSDAVSLFSNAAACIESELLCCPEVAAVDAGVPSEDGAVPAEPAQPGTAFDSGVNGGAFEPQPQDAAVDDGTPPRQPATDGVEKHSGCAIRARAGGGEAVFAAWLLALLHFARSRSRRERSPRGGRRTSSIARPRATAPKWATASCASTDNAASPTPAQLWKMRMK